MRAVGTIDAIAPEIDFRSLRRQTHAVARHGGRAASWTNTTRAAARAGSERRATPDAGVHAAQVVGVHLRMRAWRHCRETRRGHTEREQSARHAPARAARRLAACRGVFVNRDPRADRFIPDGLVYSVHRSQTLPYNRSVMRIYLSLPERKIGKGGGARAGSKPGKTCENVAGIGAKTGKPGSGNKDECDRCGENRLARAHRRGCRMALPGNRPFGYACANPAPSGQAGRGEGYGASGLGGSRRRRYPVSALRASFRARVFSTISSD